MYSFNGVRLNCRELLEISQQRWLSQTDSLAKKVHSVFVRHKYTCVIVHVLS